MVIDIQIHAIIIFSSVSASTQHCYGVLILRNFVFYLSIQAETLKFINNTYCKCAEYNYRLYYQKLSVIGLCKKLKVETISLRHQVEITHNQ